MMLALYVIVVVTLVSSLLFLVWTSGRIIVRALRRGGRREDVTDDHEALAVSRFTIPVSLIVDVEEMTMDVPASVERLLGLDYPQLEVVVIANGVTGSELAPLVDAYGLEAQEFFYRRTLTTSPVRRILRSQREERLIVVEMERTSTADALNCGVDFAQYRFVAAVSPEVTFEGDALLRAMSPALRDPARVLAVSSHIERRPEGRDMTQRQRMIARFQRLESVRAVMESRLVWQSVPSPSAPADAVVVWRRDAVLHAGGFVENDADRVLDLMSRVEAAEVKSGAHVVRTGEIVGSIAGESLTDAADKARRRRRAVWKAGLHLTGNDALRTFAIVEVMMPLAGVALLLSTVIGTAAGWWSAWTPVAAICALAYGYAAVTSAALLVRASAPGSPNGQELAQLLLVGLLEFVLYRPALAGVQIASVLGRKVPARR